MKQASWILPVGVCALVIACSRPSTSPSAPGAAHPGIADANADGSLLKATAPTPQSPVNGARLPQGQPVTLVVTNSTTP
jgi:hypothetical protein